ncbi:sirohydrochlorin chelatase [Frankia sp. CiP3]|uniref:sirohydrochlorin chelatase n=1 Tax=Frankia sp. CiP3 TaxID=2880971 RepID=UPI001EF49846|nr:CbiX/SirB N-terminal domain-containing protein [Frankia sp. CiP3]
MRGLLVIGHGSRRDTANAAVRTLARLFAQADRATNDGQIRWDAVEPAFLELIEPDIAAGYGLLAAAGCTEIVAHPFFLFEGNHTTHDIPAALTRAQERFPGTRWHLTAPLGLHPGVLAAVASRIEDTLANNQLSGSGGSPGSTATGASAVSDASAVSATGPRSRR